MCILYDTPNYNGHRFLNRLNYCLGFLDTAILLQCETVEKGRCRAWLKVKSRVSTSPPYRIQYYIIYKNTTPPLFMYNTFIISRDSTYYYFIVVRNRHPPPQPHHPGRVTDCDRFTEDFHWVFSRPERTKNTNNRFGWKCPYIYYSNDTRKTIAILFRSKCDCEKYTDIRSMQKNALNSNTDLVWTESGDCMTGSSIPRPLYTLSFLPLLVHYRRLHLSFLPHGIRLDLGYCWADVFGTCKFKQMRKFMNFNFYANIQE